MRLNASLKFLSIVFLVTAIASVQFLYDATKVPVPVGTGGQLSPEVIRMVDMGFHATVGSFLWVATMPEILDLFNAKTEYISDVSYINAIDPKLSYPYAFSTLTLPAIPTSTGYTTGLADAMTIGKLGVANANPDWRIAYYMATNYYLAFHDLKNAAVYFDTAAHTPGIPYYAQRFAENFGVGQKDRDRTIALWQTIRDTTNDPDTKARAQAYIDHLEIFNYLEAAMTQYKGVYGAFPTKLDQLVAKNIIPEIPQDPLGFQFIIGKNGTVNVDSNSTSTTH